MHKYIQQDLFDKIPNKTTLAIFGACEVGKKILEDIKQYKPECKILCFIDNNISGNFCDLPIYSLKEFINSDLKYDLVIMSTTYQYVHLGNIFDLFDIQVIPMTNIANCYYRNKPLPINPNEIFKASEIFVSKEDQDTYALIGKCRTQKDTTELKNYYYQKFPNKNNLPYLIKWQYLDKINKDAVTTILDFGLYNGLNVIAYNKYLPNLKKIYGFECNYDYSRAKYIEDFILNEKLEIVPFAIGDKIGEASFLIDKLGAGASLSPDITTKPTARSDRYIETKVNVTTIDKYCSEHNIKPDLVKMDIEGAEMPALIGGINTIKKYRPQLAISIYHTNSDFINIPLYLKNNLENYTYKVDHYSPTFCETILYAIPNELI